MKMPSNMQTAAWFLFKNQYFQDLLLFHLDELENLKLLDPSRTSLHPYCNSPLRIYRELRLKTSIEPLEKKRSPGTRFPPTFRGSSSSIAFELLFPVRFGGIMHFLDRGAPRTKVTTLHNNQE